MAVSRKPKRETSVKEKAEPKQIDIDAVINKGGSVAADDAVTLETEDELKNVQLRLYQSVIDEIDGHRMKVKKGKVPSRHAWILEAIEEKLGK